MATRGLRSDGLKTINQWYPSDEMWAKLNNFETEIQSKGSKDTQDSLVSQLAENVQDIIGRGINALNPPAPLVACKGDGTTDDSTAIQQMLNNYKLVILPYTGKSYKCNNGISIPMGVSLYGVHLVTLDFSGASSTAKLVTMNGDNTAETIGLENIVIVGSGKANAQIGLNVIGSGYKPKNVTIHDVGTGVNIANSNTYSNTFDHFSIYNCALIVNADLYTANTTNAGERIIFRDSSLFNSDKFIVMQSNVLDIYFIGCSIDYCTSFGDLINGIITFSDCHIETKSTTTTQGYLFNSSGGAHISFNDCLFDIYGINFIISATSSSGLAVYRGCYAYYRPSGSGSDTKCTSENMIFLSSGNTTFTFNSPFISKITPMMVTTAAVINNASISTAATLSLSSTLNQGTVTFSSAIPSNAMVYIKCG